MRAIRPVAPLFAGLAIVAACAPPPGPTTPVWESSFTGGPEIGGFVPQSMVLGSNSEWFIQVDADPGGQPLISFFPRVGPGNDQLGTPQVHSGGQVGLADGFLGEHILLSGATPTSGGDLQFWLETGGVWSTAGTFTQPLDTQVLALTDDTLVLRYTLPTNPELWIYDLSVTAGTVTATLDTTVAAPAIWGSDYGESFAARGVALDGDVLAAGSRDYNTGGPGRVAIYRDSGAGWSLDGMLNGPSEYFGRGLAIDDAGPAETLAVGTVVGGTAGEVHTFAADGLGWSATDTISAPPVTDAYAGAGFGDSIALDGDLMVVGVHEVALPPTADASPRVARYPTVFHRGAGGWTFEDSLQPIAEPLDTVDLDRSPINISIDDDHVAATNLVTTAASPCMFCLAVRTEAWRWERSG